MPLLVQLQQKKRWFIIVIRQNNVSQLQNLKYDQRRECGCIKKKAVYFRSKIRIRKITFSFYMYKNSVTRHFFKKMPLFIYIRQNGKSYNILFESVWLIRHSSNGNYIGTSHQKNFLFLRGTAIFHLRITVEFLI